MCEDIFLTEEELEAELEAELEDWDAWAIADQD